MKTEVLFRVLYETHPNDRIVLIAKDCIVFKGTTLRFRGPWLLIGENSYPCETPEQLLTILSDLHLIKITPHLMTSFPNRE